MTVDTQLPIPDMGIEPTHVKVGYKDVKVTWDLGREEIDLLGRPMRLVAKLWIYDSTSREFVARLGQEYRNSYGSQSGTEYPSETILRERRDRFGPKRFREFTERVLVELGRRGQDPEVRRVFDPAAAPGGDS